MGDNSGDLSLGYMMGQNDGGGNRGGLMGSNGILDLAALALLFGWGGGGFGGFGGGVNGALTRAELYDGFATQNIESAVRGVQQGICDSTYALNNSIMSGFHGVDNALCNFGYQTQSGLNAIGHQISDCCCTTQRAIDGVNYNMAKGFCDLGNVINLQTRDIIDNQNANYRGLMDFLVQEKLSSKDAQIAQLQNRLSRSEQNGVIGARIDAAVAELLRRTGNDCPTAAYLVQPPTPVNFPTNGCGQVQFGGYGGYGSGWGRSGDGCGCGCG